MPMVCIHAHCLFLRGCTCKNVALCVVHNGVGSALLVLTV